MIDQRQRKSERDHHNHALLTQPPPPSPGGYFKGFPSLRQKELCPLSNALQRHRATDWTFPTCARRPRIHVRGALAHAIVYMYTCVCVCAGLVYVVRLKHFSPDTGGRHLRARCRQPTCPASCKYRQGFRRSSSTTSGTVDRKSLSTCPPSLSSSVTDIRQPAKRRPSALFQNFNNALDVLLVPSTRLFILI